MAHIELFPAVLDDFERILLHLSSFEVEEAGERIDAILTALQILEQNPLIGRPVQHGQRELVIGRGPRGHVALYRFLPDIDTVIILAIRHQREAGFRR